MGIPIISVDRRAFFGPVLSPRPTGEDALELWDAFTSMITFDGFFELKRQFTGSIDFAD